MLDLLSALVVIKNTSAFNKVAHSDKIILVPPNHIKDRITAKHKALPHRKGEIWGGCWDYLCTRPFEDAPIYKTLFARFKEGKSWQEVEEVTGRKISKTSQESNDNLYKSLLNNGYSPSKFISAGEYDHIRVYIGRNGKIIHGKEGNHRLALAKILNIKLVAVKVWVRHSKWQAKREEILTNKNQKLSRKFRNHPDLQE